MDKITYDNIKDAYMSYKGKKMDDAFLRKVVDVYNHDSLIEGVVDIVECKDFETLCINSQTLDLLYNEEGYPKTVDRYVEAFIKQYPDNYIEIYNSFFLHFILHEFEHVKQSLYAMFNAHEYQTINDLYKLLFYVSTHASERRINNYLKNGAEYSFERNANVEAAQILYDMVDSDLERELVKVNYLLDLMLGYKIKGKNILSPVNETFKKYGFRKIQIDFDPEIPFDVAFSHGLPVDPRKLLEFYRVLDKSTLEAVDYEEQKKLLKSL